MVYRKALIASVFASSISFAAQDMDGNEKEFLDLMKFVYENAEAIVEGKISVDSESDKKFGSGNGNNLSVNAEVLSAVEAVLRIIPAKEEGAEDIEESEPVAGKTAAQKSFMQSALSWKKKSSAASEVPAVDVEAAREAKRLAAEQKAKAAEEAKVKAEAEKARIAADKKAKKAAKEAKAKEAAEAKSVALEQKAEAKRKAKEEREKYWTEKKQKAEEAFDGFVTGAANAAESAKGFFSRRLTGAQSVASQAKSSTAEKLKNASASFRKSKKANGDGIDEAVKGAEAGEVKPDNAASSEPMTREASAHIFEPQVESVQAEDKSVTIERKPTPFAAEMPEASRGSVKFNIQRRGAKPEVPPRPASYKQPAKEAEPVVDAPVEKSPIDAAANQVDLI